MPHSTQIKAIRHALAEALQQGLDPATQVVIEPYLDQFRKEGASADLDALLVILPEAERLPTGLLIGQDLLHGEAAKAFLLDYHGGGRHRLKGFLDWVAAELSANYALEEAKPILIPLRDPNSPRWRSFNPPLGLAQLRARQLLSGA